MYKNLTTEQWIEIKQLYITDQLSVSKISEEYNIPKSAIYYKFKDLEIPKSPKQLVVRSTEYLTPIKFIENKKLGKKYYDFWLYQCTCGKTKSINRCSVNKGATKSCGCLHKKSTSKLKSGESAFNRIWDTYISNAKNRNLQFNLTKEQFKDIILKNCHYCNSLPATIFTRPKINGTFIHNGIDRVDNTLGYTLDNCVPCCKICNYSKLNRTYEEFVSWVELIHKNLKEKGIIDVKF